MEFVALTLVTAIVASLAYTAYRTHQVRDQVGEGVAVAMAAAPAIGAAIRRHESVPPALSAAIPLAFESIATASSVVSLEIVDSRIDVVFAETADPAIAGRRISLTPYETADLHIVWLCGNADPGPGLNFVGFARGGARPVQSRSTIATRYLPTHCR